MDRRRPSVAPPKFSVTGLIYQHSGTQPIPRRRWSAAQAGNVPVPVLRRNQRRVENVCDIIAVPIRPQDHVTTTPAIAAVWPALRHKFFSPKTDAPAPAFSRLRKNFYPIDEHDGFKLPSARTRVIPSEVEGCRCITSRSSAESFDSASLGSG